MEGIKKTLKKWYGFDALSLGLLFIAVLLDLINLLSSTSDKNLLGILALIPLLLCVLRAFSSNKVARAKENAIFLKVFFLFSSNRKGKKKNANMADKKLFKFFKCPQCGQKVRVPKGKGKVEILCPKCSHRFIKKT